MSDERFQTDEFRHEAPPTLGVLAEIHSRLAVVEASQAEIHAKLDAAIKSGAVDPELLERVAHVVQKYFPHDLPDVAPVAVAVPRFDAFTGQPLN